MKNKLVADLIEIEDRARSLRNGCRRRSEPHQAELAELADIVTQLTQTVREELQNV